MKGYGPRTRRAFHVDRDPRSDAISAELNAEREQTDAAWLVAADAWEEAGDPDAVRFALLRQPRLLGPRPLLTRATAARFSRGGPQRSGLDAEHLSNEQQSALERFEFVRSPPATLFTYYSDDFDPHRSRMGIGARPFARLPTIHTFMSEPLGLITGYGQVRRAFNRSGSSRIVSVTVRAINGYAYHGTCQLDTGTYCRLKRGKPWLKR